MPRLLQSGQDPVESGGGRDGQALLLGEGTDSGDGAGPGPGGCVGLPCDLGLKQRHHPRVGPAGQGALAGVAPVGKSGDAVPAVGGDVAAQRAGRDRRARGGELG